MKIASACGVKSQCLRAANLELLASWGMRVFTEPGWVLSLPGSVRLSPVRGHTGVHGARLGTELARYVRVQKEGSAKGVKRDP
eukprot:1157338-Pelagomonas_calceolata.AAC.5